MTAPRRAHASTLNDHGAAAERATPRLSRCRVHTDRPGLSLRDGEVILGAPYESDDSAMVVLVRCETDGHHPGVVLSSEELEDLGRPPSCWGPAPGASPESAPDHQSLQGNPDVGWARWA